MDDKKRRIVLFASLFTVLLIGASSKLVKVKTTMVVSRVNRVKAAEAHEIVDGKRVHTYRIPEEYVLKVDNKGNLIGEKIVTKEEEVELELGQYVLQKMSGK